MLIRENARIIFYCCLALYVQMLLSLADNQKRKHPKLSSYNETKYGVDVVDQMARKYTVKTMTKTLACPLFSKYIGSSCRYKCWVSVQKINSIKITTLRFLRNLSEELGMHFVKTFTMPLTTKEGEAGVDQHFQQPSTRSCKVKTTSKRTALSVPDSLGCPNFDKLHFK